MNKYKVVLSDLDGTLLNNKSEVSRENICAIRELIKKGVHFVPVTGRTLSELPVDIINEVSIRYIIYSNGAGVLDKQTEQRVTTCIPNHIARKILEVLNSYETHITFRHGGECFVDAEFIGDEFLEYYNVCETHRVIVRNLAVCSKEFNRISCQADNVEVFSAFFHNYEDKIACKKKLEQIDELRVVEVSEYNLEIMNSNAGKGNALRILADMLDIDCTDTISIGDSDNDNSIIQSAGIGLAVSNACESLKAVADEIICSNEEHVIAYVLLHYF